MQLTTFTRGLPTLPCCEMTLLLLLLCGPSLISSNLGLLDPTALGTPKHGDTGRQADWPCPLAQEISPCTCGHSGAKLSILCDNVVTIDEIERIFSVEFPFNNLWRITLMVNDYDIWTSSEAVNIPKNVFMDKTSKIIDIGIKVTEVDPLAFENTAAELKDLDISAGNGHVLAINPIEVFPFYILEDFPNLRSFMLQMTAISDRTFEWHESRPLFSDLVLPNLGNPYKYILTNHVFPRVSPYCWRNADPRPKALHCSQAEGS